MYLGSRMRCIADLISEGFLSQKKPLIKGADGAEGGS